MGLSTWVRRRVEERTLRAAKPQERSLFSLLLPRSDSVTLLARV